MASQLRLIRIGVRSLASALMCLIWLLAPGPSQAQVFNEDGWNVELLSQIGGGALRAVALQGDLAFVGEHFNFSILDASDPSALTPVGRLFFKNEMILDLAVDGGTAIVMPNRGRLHLVDVSDPANPIRRSMLQNHWLYGLASNLLFAGAYSYDGGSRRTLLLTYDVSNLSSATLLSSWEIPSQVYGQYVAGDRLYLACSGVDLRILSFADPTSLTLIGQYDTAQYGRRVFVHDERAYLVTSGGSSPPQSSLYILDVSDPSSPTRLGSMTLADRLPAGIAASAGRAFVTYEDEYGLEIIDVSDPSSPTTRAFYRPIYGVYYGPASSGTLVWLPNSLGLDVVDTSDPASPSAVGFHRLPREVPAYDVAEGRAFYITHNLGAGPGLAVTDFADPRLPVHRAWWPHGSAQSALAAARDAVFLSDAGGLRILDFQNPTDPIVSGPFGFDGIPGDTYSAAGSDYLLMSTAKGLGIVDVTDSNAPTTVGLVSMGPNPDLDLVGDRVYTLSEGRLGVVDISDPTSPILMGSRVVLFDVGRFCAGIGLVYVLDLSEGFLRIYDTSEPMTISKVADYRLATFPTWVSPLLLEDILYVPHRSGLVELIDVSDPTSPTFCGYSVHAASDTPGSLYADVRGLRSAGNAVTVLTAKRGIWTIRYTGADPKAAVKPAVWRSYW